MAKKVKPKKKAVAKKATSKHPLEGFFAQIHSITPRFSLPAKHTDARGEIQNITELPVGSVAMISSKAGTTRAQHYHKEDAHLCYVVSGEIHYFERWLGEETTDLPKKHIFNAGDAFYTGPHMEHEMYFPQDTVFLTLGNGTRTQADYEADLVRFPHSLRGQWLKVQPAGNRGTTVMANIPPPSLTETNGEMPPGNIA